jgi:hypothetical protein
VALSTAEAEYMAICEAIKEAVWLRGLLKELKMESTKATTIFCDNQSCIELTRNPIQHSRTKHIDIKFHFIREKIKDQICEPQYLKTEEMPADVLTKALSKERHKKFVKRLGLEQKLQSGSVEDGRFGCNFCLEEGHKVGDQDRPQSDMKQGCQGEKKFSGSSGDETSVKFAPIRRLEPRRDETS